MHHCRPGSPVEYERAHGLTGIRELSPSQELPRVQVRPDLGPGFLPFTFGRVLRGPDVRDARSNSAAAVCGSACCTRDILCAAPPGNSYMRGLRDHPNCGSHDGRDRKRGLGRWLLEARHLQTLSPALQEQKPVQVNLRIDVSFA